LKKRRDVAELEEEVRQLRHQVKAKKQNISTLEELLKEANRIRNMELRSARTQGDQDSNLQRAPAPTAVDAPATLRFFVSDPHGLCVEFSERPQLTIRQLHSELARVFGQGQGAERQLVLRGQVLSADTSLGAAGLREGDSLLLLQKAPPRPQTPPPAPEPSPQLLEVVAGQQKLLQTLALDMRYQDLS